MKHIKGKTEAAAQHAEQPRRGGRLIPGSVGGLLLRALILLVIPYAYLMLCGLVFDRLLKWYFMTGFIFYSLIALYVIALVLLVAMIIIFIKRRKGA